MIKSFKYLLPYWYLIIVIFVLVALRAWLNLELPNYMRNIVNDLQAAGLTQDERITSIWTNGGWMLLNTLVGIVFTVLSGLLESRVSSKFARDLRYKLYTKVENFSMYEMDQFTTSSLITRTTNDINQIQMTVNMLLRMVVLLPFMSIGAIMMAVAMQPTVSTVLIFSVLAVLSVVGVIVFVAFPKFKIIQRLIDRLNLVTRENLSGLRVVRAFNTQESQAQKTKDVAEETMKKNVFINRIFSAMWPLIGLIMALTSAGMAWVSYDLGLIQQGSDFTAGDLSAMIQYGMQTVMSFMMITMVIIMVPRASISAKRVMDVIDAKVLVKDPKNPIELPQDVSGEVFFENVSFKYPDADEPVLKNITFKAPAKKVTAFIGSTGSGKSTLINLIPRFYDPSEGRILIDGVDIRDYRQNDFLSWIGYVPQKGNLFKGTIEDNIAFGQENLDEAVVEKSARIAQAETFIKKLDGQYQYEISQGGTNVSGGQRQRLSIARALAKQPRIYIFDDSFSALDYKTDRKLRKDLEKNVDATVLIVAQRINTIRQADVIVVLDKGEIVGIGKHEELLNVCSVYQEIAESQLSKEELAR